MSETTKPEAILKLEQTTHNKKVQTGAELLQQRKAAFWEDQKKHLNTAMMTAMTASKAAMQ